MDLYLDSADLDEIRAARIRAMLIVRRILGPTGSSLSKKEGRT